MENNLIPSFTFNYKEELLNEIALEGLEGVGFNLLWRRIEKRILSPVTEKMKDRFWGFIVHCDAICLFKLPEPLCYVEIKDRFEVIDEESGNIVDPPEYLDGPYEYHPVENDHGSSVYFNSRKKILKNTLINTTYGEMVGLYGDKLVMVASLNERLKALAPHLPENSVKLLPAAHFCMLELIGKARENGQMTNGNTNLTKIVKDAKLLYYIRKYLQDLDLIRVQLVPQTTAGRSVKTILLRLKRYHQPLLLSMPKKGKLYEVTQYLIKQPNYTCPCSDMIQLKILLPKHCKKLYKTENAFVFETIPSPPKVKSKLMYSKSISFNPPSEESSQSEDEATEETQLKSQYQVNVSLMRQAYERILEAGLEGLNQVQLCQILNIGYYTARNMCRLFKAKNIVKEIFVDKGKQRIAKYVASAAAGIDADFEAEKKKFLQYLDESKNATKIKLEQSDSEFETPKKKRKICETPKGMEDIIPDSNTLVKNVTEVKFFEGTEYIRNQSFLGPGRPPTLRLLKFANGILEVIRKQSIVTGFMNINCLAAKECNEPRMDTKALKIVIQKLVTDGQVKLLKMTGANWHKPCILLCAPHVLPTDEMVKNKYKELSIAALRSRKLEKKKVTPVSTEALPRPAGVNLYPRYLKIQKLHESLIKTVYFNEDEGYRPLTPGVSSLADVIPEFTVEFVIGNMNNDALMSLSQLHIPQSMMKQRLRSVPAEMFKTLFATPRLQACWRQNLKLLSALGLIQLIKYPVLNEDNLILSYEFYVNRRASILNTTGEFPRDNFDKEALKKTYYFETFEDVKKYWHDVKEISTNTLIRLEANKRCRHPVPFVARLVEEVEANDNGQFQGNGLGPCGFDSSFYMDISKLWLMCHQRLKHALLKKMPIKIPTRRRVRKTKLNVKKKAVVSKPIVSQNKPKRNPSSSLPKWSKEEDKILMLCKAATTVLSPTAHTGCLKLRNLIAKDILTLFDAKKIGSICHKRALMLDSNTSLEYEKDCLINELRRYPEILKRYEGLYRNGRIQFNGNISKVIAAVRVPALELVWVLMQMLKSESFNKKVPCVALNLEHFYKNYTVCPSTVNFNSYRTEREAGPVLAAVKEGIIIALMHSYRSNVRTETARTIHGMLSVHPEQLLRPAVDQLRKAGAVSAREKAANNDADKYHIQDIAHSSFKISSSYQRRWICRMNSELADNLMFLLEDDLKGNSELSKDDLKVNPEVNCLMFEMQTCGLVDFVIKSPPALNTSGWPQEENMSVNDITLSSNLKSGSVGFVHKNDLDKFSELFKDIDYGDALKCVLRATQVTKPPDNMDTDDEIISHLQTQNKAGATFEELKNVTGYDIDTLTRKLKSLESDNIVKRLGYYENLLVLTKFANPWTVNVNAKQVIPTPWVTTDLDIRNDVFLKWAGVIVNKVFMKPGSSIEYLSNECEYLTTRATQDICVVLEKCKCVTLKVVNISEPDLFSDGSVPEFEEFNPYAMVENMLVFPVRDMLTRYAYIRKKMFDDQYYFENT